MAQYPELHEKNFIGIARLWDSQNPPPTFEVLPPKTTPFHFSWRIVKDPNTMAPYVAEGADTPLTDAEASYESFVCREARLGAKITQREINFGIGDVVYNRVTALVNAINLTRLWDNIQTICGYNVHQPLSLQRMKTGIAGKPHGTGTAKAWNESGADPIADILAMKTIMAKGGYRPRNIYMPLEEYEALQNNSEIIDQIKYTDGTLLVRGEIERIKGLNVRVVDQYWKARKPNGEEEKHFVLRDQVILTAENVGFTGIAEPMSGTAPMLDRWWEKKQRSVYMHAFSSFVTVVEDYAKIGIITGTDVNASTTTPAPVPS
jgi:hypothetical protein